VKNIVFTRDQDIGGILPVIEFNSRLLQYIQIKISPDDLPSTCLSALVHFTCKEVTILSKFGINKIAQERARLTEVVLLGVHYGATFTDYVRGL